MGDRKDGGPAFPLPVAEIHGVATHSGEFGPGMCGMSLRDYFAAHALPAVVAAAAGRDTGDPGVNIVEAATSIAKRAFLIADAMIAESRDPS